MEFITKLDQIMLRNSKDADEKEKYRKDVIKNQTFAISRGKDTDLRSE